MFDDTDDEESTAGEARPTTQKTKRGSKKAAKPKPEAVSCPCCKREIQGYQLNQRDAHGNCENCVERRESFARTVVHALAADNVDPADVAERAVSYADHLLLELARRPIGGEP